MTVTLEQIKSYAAGIFSELSSDVSVERDPNSGKVVFKAEAKVFHHTVAVEIDESSTLNHEMESMVRLAKDELVRHVMSGAAPARVVPVPDTEPAPAPIEPAAVEQPVAEVSHDSPAEG